MLRIIVILTILYGILFIIGGLTSCRYAQDASDTAFNEFKASESLRKYEWFKDAHASLKKKEEDIKVVELKILFLIDDYESIPRSQWDRTDKETLRIWQQELSGIKMSYNSLAAEYNSNSSKFNWSYAEGDIPKQIKKLN